jgi:hypothetical protein
LSGLDTQTSQEEWIRCIVNLVMGIQFMLVSKQACTILAKSLGFVKEVINSRVCACVFVRSFKN